MQIDAKLGGWRGCGGSSNVPLVGSGARVVIDPKLFS